jgi:hypothetical protein
MTFDKSQAHIVISSIPKPDMKDIPIMAIYDSPFLQQISQLTDNTYDCREVISREFCKVQVSLKWQGHSLDEVYLLIATKQHNSPNWMTRSLVSIRSVGHNTSDQRQQAQKKKLLIHMQQCIHWDYLVNNINVSK